MRIYLRNDCKFRQILKIVVVTYKYEVNMMKSLKGKFAETTSTQCACLTHIFNRVFTHV